MSLKISSCSFSLLCNEDKPFLNELTAIGFKIANFEPLTFEGTDVSLTQIRKCLDALEKHQEPKEDDDFVVINKEETNDEVCKESQAVSVTHGSCQSEITESERKISSHNTEEAVPSLVTRAEECALPSDDDNDVETIEQGSTNCQSQASKVCSLMKVDVTESQTLAAFGGNIDKDIVPHGSQLSASLNKDKCVLSGSVLLSPEESFIGRGKNSSHNKVRQNFPQENASLMGRSSKIRHGEAEQSDPSNSSDQSVFQAQSGSNDITSNLNQRGMKDNKQLKEVVTETDGTETPKAQSKMEHDLLDQGKNLTSDFDRPQIQRELGPPTSARERTRAPQISTKCEDQLMTKEEKDDSTTFAAGSKLLSISCKEGEQTTPREFQSDRMSQSSTINRTTTFSHCNPHHGRRAMNMQNLVQGEDDTRYVLSNPQAQKDVAQEIQSQRKDQVTSFDMHSQYKSGSDDLTSNLSIVTSHARTQSRDSEPIFSGSQKGSNEDNKDEIDAQRNEIFHTDGASGLDTEPKDDEKHIILPKEKYELAEKYFSRRDVVSSYLKKATNRSEDSVAVPFKAKPEVENVISQIQNFQRRRIFGFKPEECEKVRELLNGLDVVIALNSQRTHIYIGGTAEDIQEAEKKINSESELNITSTKSKHTDEREWTHEEHRPDSTEQQNCRIETQMDHSFQEIKHESTGATRNKHPGGARRKETHTSFEQKTAEPSSHEQMTSYQSIFHSADYKFKVEIRYANITKLKVDCIVNAANRKLKHGGGVARAIADAAGKELMEACKTYTDKGKQVEVTGVFVSPGGKLPAKNVLHAVGPRYDKYTDKDACAEDLKATILRCLIEAARLDMTSIALPSISAAIFKVPKRVCAESYLKAVKCFSKIWTEPPFKIAEFSILFVDIDSDMINIIKEEFHLKWRNEPTSSDVDNARNFMLEHCTRVSLRNRDQHNSSHVQQKSSFRPSFDYIVNGNVTICVREGHALAFASDAAVAIGGLFQELTESSTVLIEENIVHLKEVEDIRLVQFESRRRFDKSKQLMCVVPLDVTCAKLTEKDKRVLLKKLMAIIRLAEIKNAMRHIVFSCKGFYKGKAHNASLASGVSSVVFEFASSCQDEFGTSKITIVTGSESLAAITKVFDSRADKGLVTKTPRRDIPVETPKSREPRNQKTHQSFQGNTSCGQERQTVSSSSAWSSAYQEAGQNKSKSQHSAASMDKPMRYPHETELRTSVTDLKCDICYDRTATVSCKRCPEKICKTCDSRVQRCPYCGYIKYILTGNQPMGHMTYNINHNIPLTGYEQYPSLEIEYSFSSGTQGVEHNNPGKRYKGTTRTAYLPGSPDGWKVLKLLRMAFKRRLVFTIGTSSTSAQDDCVIWNGIHHKTRRHDSNAYGYPDPKYLSRVYSELQSLGVTEDIVTPEEERDLSLFLQYHF